MEKTTTPLYSRSNGTKTANTFDYESNASSYTIAVQAKDELNAAEGNFTVTLLDDDTEDRDGDGFTDGQKQKLARPQSIQVFLVWIHPVAWYP